MVVPPLSLFWFVLHQSNGILSVSPCYSSFVFAVPCIFDIVGSVEVNVYVKLRDTTLYACIACGVVNSRGARARALHSEAASKQG